MPDPHRLDGDFTISLRVCVPADRAGAAGGLACKFDPVARTGFNLSAISSAGGYNGPCDELRISFGIDAGSEPRWFDRGRPSPTSNYVSNSLTVFDGALHAATWNYDWTRVHDEILEPCRVYRYERPGRWADCGRPGNSRRIFSLASYRGDLLAIGDDSTLHAYRGGAAWEQVMAFGTFAHPAGVHDGRLVLGMLQPATVHTFDGAVRDDLGNPLGDPTRCDEIHTLITYRGALHAGTWPLGRVARWDAGRRRWQQTGRLGDSSEIMALNVYNGKLYGAAIPRAEVFRYERDASWTSLRRLFDPPGWTPVMVRNMSTEEGLRRHREWTRVTSLTQHDGVLASRPPASKSERSVVLRPCDSTSASTPRRSWQCGSRSSTRSARRLEPFRPAPIRSPSICARSRPGRPSCA